jgi:adenine-specific DNA-methyltransferase
MPTPHADVEEQRLSLQAELDGQKTQAERNRLGQFATPTALALEILRYAKQQLPRGKVRFLDPALGTGAFYSALRHVFSAARIADAVGFELDPHYGIPALQLWQRHGLTLRMQDFTAVQAEPSFNLLICNPPYVRHHHLAAKEKQRLGQLTVETSGLRMSGLTGLYGYFLALGHAWLAEGGLSGWLIPSEFMDVNYGAELKRYLLTQVTLLHIHRFDPSDVQFADALVSSAVVWFRKAPPPMGHQVRFTFGGSLSAPAQSREVSTDALLHEPKWTRFPQSAPRSDRRAPVLSDYFQIRRGLATGDNDFFILSDDEIAARGLPRELFTPILPSPRYLSVDEVGADREGLPIIERRLFLLDTRLKEDEIARRFPTLAAYLGEGKERGLHERYLCRHRSPWYAQEQRPAAPIVCTYLGRGDTRSGRPFRFILNASRATVANVYLALYPHPRLASGLAADPSVVRRIWEALNRIPAEKLLGEGRVYGGGLHKLEPRELANVPVPELEELLPAAKNESAQTRFDGELFV